MRPNQEKMYRCRRLNGRGVLLVTVVIVIGSLVAAGVCNASQTFGRRPNTSSDGTIAPISPFKRKFQSWLIRSGSQSKISATMRRRIKRSTTQNGAGRNKKIGSFMTSQRPTKERLYRWFGVEGEDPNQFMRCMMLRNEFNHNLCGITNPFLKVLRPSKPPQDQHAHRDADTSNYSELADDTDRQIELKHLPVVKAGDHKGQGNKYKKIVLAARSNRLSPSITLGSSTTVEDSWWPSLQIAEKKNEECDNVKKLYNKWRILRGKNSDRIVNGAQGAGFRKQNWRILKYRKRVGRGRNCYEKVRDAALDWEFQSADGSTGMMQVPDRSPRDYFQPDTLPVVSSQTGRSYSVQPIDEDASDSTSYPNAHSSSLYRSLGSRRLVSFASKSVAEFLPSFLRRRIYSINPVCVVYDVVDQRAPDGQTTFTSTAYATMKGHFLSGEERVTVALRDGSQDVEVEILSISRAGPGLFGKTMWPFIGKMQSNFFQQQLDHLSRSGLVIDGENSIGGDTDKNSGIVDNYLLD